MTQDTKPGIASAPRYVYGPRPIGTLLPQVTRPAFRRTSPATAQVMADWTAIVGPALAGVTRPQRLTAGQLTIACSGPIAMELQHLADELVGRINTYLGKQAVKRLRFVQTRAPAPPPSADPPAPPSEAMRRQAEQAVADLPEGDLRAALIALGATMLDAATRLKSST